MAKLMLRQNNNGQNNADDSILIVFNNTSYIDRYFQPSQSRSVETILTNVVQIVVTL